ncbi:protein FORGETTER 1-like [Pomacea canaliculata]|uniref:protein FORGETTER 1-like n=1 Tax=Pomacea canaliculata TaxID=400727 RepID=UPI000D73CCF2|nr:protein FORGETTER 1-like [Pomacea canaliculata]XP_025103700.1 protein FORGETTER 1-like [Pomacea canaliculata]XP_025103701.1 protein FORGETTER 1-like [Pomacea canaliculata]
MSLLPQQVASRNQNVAVAMPTVSAVVSFPAPTEDVSLDIAQEGVQESASEEVFSNYRHREVVAGCKPHPADIVEAAPLAALDLPKEYYPITDSLTEEAIKECRLSSLQLEGIIHACQRHQVILANGQRAGFFIGDGAGVGKGRQIAGILLDNIARGRTRHIWFTISADLIVDARRDLTDIGCYTKVIEGCQELDRETRALGLPHDFKEGIIFSTYASLVSSVQHGGKFSSTRRSRLQQLMDWCGGTNFEGCLIFDECHKAKNFVPDKEKASTKVALAVTEIQRLLPKARVVYCSATGVSGVKNMAFMERLGLWGDGAPFQSFEQFFETVHRKGLGVAEMLAMEMKSSGIYVSRGLSFRQAEFVTVEVPLTPEQRKVYDTAANLWNEVQKALAHASARTGDSYSRLWTQYWASHQRFFRQLCISMKVPAVVAETKVALDTGHAVIIGLQTTGEASLDSEVSRNNGNIKGFISVCREILLNFIKVYFPTRKEQKPGDTKPPEEDPWSVQAKQILLNFAEKLDLPNSSLDELIDLLGGPSKVAEMTGRRARLVRHSPKDKVSYEQRANHESGTEYINVKERNQFMEGKKLVAIISDAASTGISLHADLRVENRRRRVHITLELPWSADKAVQQLGRSHRSSQSSGPLYKLLTTDLGGERRFAAAVARRLQSLGALTKGDRRAAIGADLMEFNLDTPYGRSALKIMYNSISQKQLAPGVQLSKLTTADFMQFNDLLQESLVQMGVVEQYALNVGAMVPEKHMGDVTKFLNRILGLPTDRQNLIFSYFTECLDVIVQNAKREGRYNEGLLDVTAASIQMVKEPQEVFKHLQRGHGATKLVELDVDRGMSWEMAMKRYENYCSMGLIAGFYVSKRDMFGQKMYILATPKENSTHLFHIARPNTGVSAFEQEKTDLLNKYTQVTLDAAEKGWRRSYESSKDNCMHGRHCKFKDSCTVGKRSYRLHLLCGNIATLLTVLESVLIRNIPRLGLSKYESQLRVVRVAVDGGERVVGVRYPEVLIPEVEVVLKEQKLNDRLARVQAALVCKQQAETAAESLPSSNSQQQSKPFVHSQARIEDVTPVNQKHRTQALRPPVTIKSFFKPKSQTLGNNENLGHQHAERNGVSKNLTEKDKVFEDAERPSCSDQSVPVNSDTNKHLKGHDKDDEDGNSLTNPLSEDSSDFQKVTKNCHNNDNPRAKTDHVLISQSKVLKRKSVKPSKNKCKKPDGTKKGKFVNVQQKCPICQEPFKPGASNQDINAHIDNCVIE